MILVRDNVPIPNLKWSCLDVSLRYLACGTSTGSIYIYRRSGGQGQDRITTEHVDTASTNQKNAPSITVELCQFSPDERKLAVALSSGSILIIELNLDDSRKKPQISHRCVPEKDHKVTTIQWTSSSRQIYLGTTGGKIIYLNIKEVSSNLAKLQSMVSGTKLFVLCVLDSEIIQLERHNATGDILASTVTRCVVVPHQTTGEIKNNSSESTTASITNSNNKTATNHTTTITNTTTTTTIPTTSTNNNTTVAAVTPKQIGKKLRNGRYGACFCSYSDPAAKIALAQLSSQQNDKKKESKESVENPEANDAATKDDSHRVARKPAFMYAARPGKRVWLANATDQHVLVTLKLKNKMPTKKTSYFLGREKPISKTKTNLNSSTTTASKTSKTASHEFSKLATFRTNQDEGELSDVLLSWNQTAIYFISTDISASENVKVVAVHEDLGKIEQLVVCNGDCVESGSGFFVLHRDVNEGGNTAMQLSRIVSLSPRTFLASYHAEDTSLLTCIQIAVKNHVMDFKILERLNNRLKKSTLQQTSIPFQKDTNTDADTNADTGADMNADMNADMDTNTDDVDSVLQKFMEVLEAVRADVELQRSMSPRPVSPISTVAPANETTPNEMKSNMQNEVNTAKEQKMEEKKKVGTVTEDEMYNESKNKTNKIQNKTKKLKKHMDIKESQKGTLGTEKTTNNAPSTPSTPSTPSSSLMPPTINTTLDPEDVSPSVILFSTVDEMIQSVLALWSNNDIAVARNHYKIYVASIQNVNVSIPKDIPDDVVSLEEVKEFFVSLRAHINQMKQSDSTTHVETKKDNGNDSKSDTLSSKSWSTPGGTVVGYSYEGKYIKRKRVVHRVYGKHCS